MSDSQIPINFEQTVAISVDALWGSATPELLRLLREDRRVERKPPLIRPRELAEYFSMWANTATEGGLIAVGMSDDGKLLGCLSVEIEYSNRLESESCNYCPQAHIGVKRVPIKRDKDGRDDFVLLFRVPYKEDRVVHTSDGTAYIRRGETKHKLRPEEIRDLQNDKGEVRVEKELYPTYRFPEDFDANLVKAFAKAFALPLNMN
jgi:ATP-dependent DNA helicase RecG